MGPSSSSADVLRPSPRACDACRGKHLRCDGASPVCRRCLERSLSCVYTPSRRGMARRAHRRTGRPTSPESSVDMAITTATMATTAPLATTAVAVPRSRSLLTPPEPCFDQLAPSLERVTTPSQQDSHFIPDQSHSLPTSDPSAATTPWSLRAADRDRLLGLFYSNFFRAHPFLVPKAFYTAQHYPRYLDLTVCFVGLHYASPAPDDAASLREAVSLAISEPDEQTAHRVQALVLYAIALHSCQQQREAATCVARAAIIAMNLGLNEPAFAHATANDSQIVEESLKRTWWELYTVDVYIAAIHRRSTFETISVRPHPLLPCSQTAYESGQCELNPPTLRAFEDRVFSLDSQVSFPSICYRIEAIRIVGRVLSLAATDEAHPDSIQALDNALASWKHNLPACCLDMVDSSGEVDLMLFEARCFISCASIFLHFPRSDLPATIPSAGDIACAKGYTQLAPTSGHHTIKAIAASKDLSNLASIPFPLEHHSPFFICGLILGCVVQLAVAMIHLHQCGLECLQQHRDRVVLMIGTIQRMGETWPLAQNTVRCLKSVAETVFSSHYEDEATSSQAASLQNSLANVGENFSNPPWFDLFLMESIDNMQSNLFNM